MKIITTAFVMSHNPCWENAEKRIETLLGRYGKTLRQCMNLYISDADKIWLATLRGVCSERVQRLFAAACSERALPLFEAQYPDDIRPRVAIQTAVRFALGQATREELDAAHVAASEVAEVADTAMMRGIEAAAAAAAADAAETAKWATYANADKAAFYTAAATWGYYALKSTTVVADPAWQVETMKFLLEEYE